ncbi:MAG: phosphopentomutase/phosphoglucosamine mutase [Methanoregula sp.]|nr:phosphopentomutase/phosphoglucosamine mutase [Methanoregula sp.]
MLFGSSGIRRRFDQELIDLALRAGSALAASSSDVIVGMDTRTTSPLLAHLLISGILGSGGTAYSCGIAPTPTIAYAARNARAACMITASHNPEEYNGLKLFNSDGSSFTRRQQAEMEGLLKSGHWTDWKVRGSLKPYDAISLHRSAIIQKVNISREMSAVVDCGNGAGCMLTPHLLLALGISPFSINCDPSGQFFRPSEPLEKNLPYISGVVRSTGAQCAVAHDGDADRMMAWDGKGNYISGDHMLMLFAQYLDARRVVTTSDASMIIEEVAEVRRTPVGDAYVSEELLSWGDFGGEPSGAWIFPRVSYCPDGPFAAALFCEIASEWDVEEEINNMPSYPIVRESFACESAREILSALGAENPTDGIRIEEENGWCLVRASGTEPKIRLTAEGKTRTDAKKMRNKGRFLISQGKTA